MAGFSVCRVARSPEAEIYNLSMNKAGLGPGKCHASDPTDVTLMS